MKQPPILLVYDKACPACQFYCQLVRVRQSVGELQLIDARSGHPVMAQISAAGLDIDQGMVLKLGDQLYYAADAIHMLSLISLRAGVFNRFNAWLFSRKSVACSLYPVLRSGRNLLLKLLRRRKVNNLQRDIDPFF